MKIVLDTTPDKNLTLLEEIQEVNEILFGMTSRRFDGLVVDEKLKKNMLNASRNFTSNCSKSFVRPVHQSNTTTINITIDFITDKNQ